MNIIEDEKMFKTADNRKILLPDTGMRNMTNPTPSPAPMDYLDKCVVPTFIPSKHMGLSLPQRQEQSDSSYVLSTHIGSKVPKTNFAVGRNKGNMSVNMSNQDRMDQRELQITTGRCTVAS